MRTPTRDEELAALRRPFRIGVLAVFAVVVAIGGVVAAFGTTADRPAGIAERWLVAVGDTTRDGIEADGLERAREYGDPGLVAALIPAQAITDGERAFEDIQVGRDLGDAGDGARIPFRLTPYEGEDVTGVVTLARVQDRWAVTSVAPVDGVRIDRPERAPLGLWVGALGLGALITAACVVAVRAATPGSASRLP